SSGWTPRWNAAWAGAASASTSAGSWSSGWTAVFACARSPAAGRRSPSSCRSDALRGGRVEERHRALPPGAKHLDERRRRDERRAALRRSLHARRVAGRRPGEELPAASETRRVLDEHERGVGEVGDGDLAFAWRQALVVELRVDRVRADLARTK